MHIDLVFPPVHDPAMPHGALPLLKSYIERNSTHKVKCHDFNRKFYSQDVLISESPEALVRYRRDFAMMEDVADAVSSALRFDSWLKRGFNQWARKHDGYDVTFRNLGAPVDRRDPAAVRDFALSSEQTPFDALYREFIGQVGPVVGINLSVEDQILPAFRLAGLIRRRHGSQSRIIWGGSLLARIYPVIVSDLVEFWDYLVIREGEAPLLAILRQIDGEESLPPGEDRIIEKSSDRSFDIANPFVSANVTNIDSTGNPDYSDYPVRAYYSLIPMLPVLASRKCYWGKCQFCTIHDSWDPLHRQRSAVAVSSEIGQLCSSHGIRHFRFVDEAMPPDLIDAILPLIEPYGVAFEIYAIAERRFRDSEFVRRLGSGGCRQAYFGLESADEAALVAMGKRINQHRHYSEIFSSCADCGIHVYVYTLFGFPGSSDFAEQKTVDFISGEMSVHSATISSFVPVAGSPFALENAGRLFHSNRMTEDFESVAVGMKKQDLGETAREAAGTAVQWIYGARPDLALTATLNDEVRFSLSDRFGASFASRALASGRLDIESIMRSADATMTHERIARKLD